MVDYVFKIVLIGPGAVGKTSLMQRYVHNRFSERYELTIGVDFLSKDVKIGDIDARLTIWDIGGQDRFKFMRNRFYDGANGALLIFDLSRAQTYTDIRRWLAEFRQFAGPAVPFLLIGNKADLIKDVGEIIDQEEARSFAEKENSFYIETSAKTGTNVEEAFIQLTQKLIKR